MSFDPSKRLRFGVSKVRSGCLTCKFRHLKCDEGRPSCLRCLKSRRECRRRASETKELSIVHYSSSAPLQSMCEKPSMTRQEQQLLHDFQTWTGPELAGVYDPELWLRYITQIATSEPVVKHAILAVTTIHKQFRDAKDLKVVDGVTAFALQHYTCAISLLIQSMNTNSIRSPDTPLIACVLFCAFESMSFHLDSAISHAGSGIRMLMERRSLEKQESSAAIPPRLLAALYRRLDTQGIELGETSFAWQHRMRDFHYTRVLAFRDTEDLQTSFDELANALLHAVHQVDRSTRSCPQADYQAFETLQTLTREFSGWCSAFDIFVNQKASKANVAPLLLLQIWRILLTVNLQVNLEAGDMDFDRFASEFEQITKLSSAFVFGGDDRTQSKSMQECTLSRTISHEPQTVYRSKTEGNFVRCGYLGINPCCTPLAPGDQYDPHTILSTTKTLLEIHQRPCQSKNGLAPILGARICQSTQKPSYCLSPGIVSPLFVTISRCRDPQIRRRALALMQGCKRREGLWDSHLAARLGIRVIQIEEQRAEELNVLTFETSAAFSDAKPITSASQIPNQARVRMIKPTFLPDRRSIERYYLGWRTDGDEFNTLEETWIEELMEW